MTGSQGLPFLEGWNPEVGTLDAALESQIPKSLCAVAWTMLPPRVFTGTSCLLPHPCRDHWIFPCSPLSHRNGRGFFPPWSVFYRIFHGPMSLCLPIEALALARPHPTILQEMGCSYVKRIAKHVSQDGMCMHMSMHLCVDSRNSSASAWWQVP